MVVANYKSFEADDLHMATLSTEEAESLALVPDAGVTDVVNPIMRQRTNRNRFISVVSLILAIVGVTLLVSFSTGSSSKTTSSNTDLHSFDSISPDATVKITNLSKVGVPTKMPTKKRSRAPSGRKTLKPSALPTSEPTEMPTEPVPTALPTTASPVEENIMNLSTKTSSTGIESTRAHKKRTRSPTAAKVVTKKPTALPSALPSDFPTSIPTTTAAPTHTASPVEEESLNAVRKTTSVTAVEDASRNHKKRTRSPTASKITKKPTALPSALPSDYPTSLPTTATPTHTASPVEEVATKARKTTSVTAVDDASRNHKKRTRSPTAAKISNKPIAPPTFKPSVYPTSIPTDTAAPTHTASPVEEESTKVARKTISTAARTL